MLEQLFKFPVVTIDGDNEDRKEAKRNRLNLPKDEESLEYDIIFGEAEYPYWDFIGVEDRWLPTEESLAKALDGRFNTCIVRFANVGQLLVPWSKKKFKAELIKFAEEYEANFKKGPEEGRDIKIITLTPDQYKKATDEE